MMRKLFTFLFAALMSVGMWAVTPQGADTWDEGTKTLTVNSNPGSYAYFKSDIKNLVISDAVTSIGDHAFEECTALTSVTFGNSVTSIGGYAFYLCPGLTSVTIGNSVESIGGAAFCSCTGLISIEIPNSVTSIGARVFWGCTSLTIVTIGTGVTSIGADAFYSCTAVTDVYCYPNAADLTWNEDSEDDFKANKETRCHVHADQLSAYQEKFTGEVNVTFVGPPVVPSWVRAGDEWDETTKTLTVNSNPGWRAYKGQTEIEHVIINNSVTSIGNSAFEDCSGLTSVTISNSVTSIGIDAFYECPNITDVYCYPNAADLTWNEDFCDDFKDDGSTECHVHADQFSAYQSKFTGEVHVTFVGDLPGGSPATVAVTGVTLDQSEAQMTVGEELTLTATVNPNNATNKDVMWSSDNGYVATIENGVITAEGEGTATITVTTVDGEYTATCAVTVTAPEPANSCGPNLTWEFNPSTGVLTISGTGAMYDYDDEVNYAPWISSYHESITSVIISDGVTSIGQMAFLYCAGLTSVTIGNSVESIGLGAFAMCRSLSSIEIPSSVESIGMYAFMGCTGLTSVTIPNSVPSIGEGAFQIVQNIVYSGSATGSPWGARSVNGYVDGFLVYSNNTKTNLKACSSQATGTIEIPNSVTSIGDYAFYYCPGITSITIPNSVISIGENAFDNCSGLTSITIPNSVTSIGGYAFQYCLGLESVTIGNSVTSIGLDAFYDCTNITDVYCYADPNNLTWNDGYCDDFANDHATVCHVMASALATYEANWGGTLYNDYNTGVNVTFVGDLDAPASTDEQVPTNADPENPSYYYSTFFHSTQKYALTNDGTQAFVADLSGSDLVLTKIAEGTDVIPANTAVIFRKAGSADPVVLNPTDAEAVSFTANNDLEGVDAETAVTAIDGLTTANCYVLSGTNEHGVGFYRINSDNLKAHKAYVKYVGTQNNAPRRMRFVFEQENTATGVENANLKSEIKNQKFIKDGQLIIIKNGVRYNAQGQVIK